MGFTQHVSLRFRARIRRGIAGFSLGLCLFVFATLAVAEDPAADQVLRDAQAAEAVGDYLTARVLYHRYLEIAPVTADRRALTLRASVLGEAVRYGSDGAVPLLLDALTAREAGDVETALQFLREVDRSYPDSTLHDDALYLIGYLALLDRVDFEMAHAALRRVQVEYPDSHYIDTAMYSEAIALEQLGNTRGAYARFAELRDRHARFSLGILNQYWPKGTVLSRYWFDRASRRLEILDARMADSATLTERRVLQRGNILRVTVNVDGVDLVLLLQPSQVISNLVIKDAANLPVTHPETRYFSGRVEGDEESWARVALSGDDIEGVVMSYGVRYALESDSLVGTIEFYQPKFRSDAASTGLQDYVMHPPALNQQDTLRSGDGGNLLPVDSDLVNKVAHLAIVVDTQYDDYYGGHGLARALGQLNIADGIYREDFGLALQVESAIVFTDREQDPMNLGAVPLETTLRRFRDYRMANAADLPDVSLVYLFTGNQNSDQAIGLAWIGAACRQDGFDVGVTTPSLFGDLLLTHELGHSLGAQHDTDTTCSGETNRLMWPRISSLTAQEFTQCSLTMVHQGLSQSCHSEALDVSLDVQLPDPSQIEAIIRNTDPQRVVPDTRLLLERTAVSFASVPPQCIEVGESELECRTGTLQAGASMTLSFLLADEQPPTVSMLLNVEPVSAVDVNQVNNSVQVDLTRNAAGETDIEIAAIDTESATVPDSEQTEVADTPVQATTSTSAGGAISVWGTLVLLMLSGYRTRKFYRYG